MGGGVRVPFVVRWPNMIKRGISTPALAANIDILPTLIAACEVAGPVKPIDGQSFLPLLQGERLTAREVFAYYYGDRPRRFAKADGSFI